MWHGRRVIVAGGTAGFGLVLGRHLARRGARVLLIGRSSEGVRRALAVCEQDGPIDPAIRGVTADLAQPGEGNRVAGEALRILGGIDDLVYCVGRSGRAAILRTERTVLQEYLDANLLAAVELTRAVAEDIAASHGHVVYIGSLAGKLVTPYMGPYAVTKSALAAYADAVRLELEPRGGHVLLVSSGPIARASDDPATDRGSDRYAADVAASDLPAEAIAPGGTRAVKPMNPDTLASQVLAAWHRRVPELTVPGRAMFIAGLLEWFPRFGRWLLSRMTRR
jgi:short-subunit dehydrogenase